MPTVNVHAAKSQLSRLLDAAAAGEEVVIARAGKPIARLVPVEQKKEPRKLGALAGKLHVPDDFDDPLPDEIIADFEGR
ncbi:MAG TPA: type II toxin-antitoxin system prevent-host-death family antitoxin [Acetobacteraceae bacterium]|jgi:prevent-host-death family protein|nr:type II toxin-antitoxin system prevent-host-death family antitoxin [Acetobacteraceae bacterium]